MTESTTMEAPEQKSANAFTAFEKYDDFTGKATRSEFWAFFLLIHVVVFILIIPAIPIFFSQMEYSIDNYNWHAPLALILPIAIWGLIVLIPLLALLFRRLRNMPKKFWIGYIGGAAVLFILALYNVFVLPVFGPFWLSVLLFEILFIGAGSLPEEASAE